jgi:RNA polymerase sigma factor (TIGR02999 family)
MKPSDQTNSMTAESVATEILVRWNDGDEAALTELVPIVETELRRLARGYLRRERPEHTLQTTALVNEAYLRLITAQGRNWKNRAHFVGMAARVMRQVLVDHARKRGRLKRGGSLSTLFCDEGQDVPRNYDIIEYLSVHDALSKLAALDLRQSRLVELKVFGGLVNNEVSEVMDISLATVKREWDAAKAWLYLELAEEK